MSRNNTSGDGAPGFVTEALLEGRFYSTGQYFSGVSDTNTKQLYLENPADSDVVVLPVHPTVRSTAKVKTDKHKNVTVNAVGNPPDTGVTNKASDAEDDNVATARVGGAGETGDYGSGTSFSTKVSGSQGTSPGQAGQTGVTNAIFAGDNVVVEATADGGSRDISIDIDFIEYPVSRLP